MIEFCVSCRRTIRLFLRRLYVSRKADREQIRIYEDEVKPDSRSNRGCLLNLLLLFTFFLSYYFISLRAQNDNSFNENVKIDKLLEKNDITVEDPIGVPQYDIQKHHLEVRWLKRNSTIKFLGPTTTKHSKRFKLNDDAIEDGSAVDDNDDAVINKGSWLRKIDAAIKVPSQLPTEKPLCVLSIDTMSDTRVKLQLQTANTSTDIINPLIVTGGYYKPNHCTPAHKVAIIVPFRNRHKSLSVFLLNIHPFLIAQNLEYRIFVIEQFGTSKFNKGRLCNAGFLEIKKFGRWSCVVFHDVDLLPLDHRILYTCPKHPRHMSVNVGNENPTAAELKNASNLPVFGGVTALLLEHYEKVNGHSNLYWGSGEDYDMFWRLRAAKIPIFQYNQTVAKYYSLQHLNETPNPLRHELLKSAVERWRVDGLNTIKYQVKFVGIKTLYTHISVDVNPS